MAYLIKTLDDAKALVGTEIGVSNWIVVDQERINKFADATDDHQWIHTDPERAAKELPLGTTCAHGYLTISLIPALIGLYPMSDARTPFRPIRHRSRKA